MFGYKSKINKLLHKHLRQQVDFKFNSDGIKNRLLTSMKNESVSSTHEFPQPMRSWKMTFGSGMIVFFAALGTLSYADSTKPGDKLYFLDQWQEQVALKIPQSVQSKSKLKSDLIDERLQEIKKLENTTEDAQNLKIETINRTQQNIIETVDETADIKHDLQNNGRNKSVNQVNNVLMQLENLAQEQETQIEELQKNTKNEKDQEQFETNLQAIKKARLKARLESE